MFEFITAKEIAEKLKGKLPSDFKNFEALTCHSAEASAPNSLNYSDLEKATKTTTSEEIGKREAYAQTLVNELKHRGSFNEARVKGYVGAVIVDSTGKGRRSIVKTDDYNETVMLGRDVKYYFDPSEFKK
ncbi:hypothetical protein ABH309_19500 [Chromobacterium piscinae]|uniref:Uncharacterized protein n=1 Tax=Chromobacterium piscinae TaxID=686831 RepID=A0ABV0H963_9NEIS